MSFNDEKDYIMRMINEMVRVLMSLVLGKKYVQVELPEENKYEVSGSSLEELKSMVDAGKINEAENLVLDGLDYSDRQEVAAAVLFYQYVGAKDEDFLRQHNYSRQEVLEGLQLIAKKKGCAQICDIL